MVSKINGPVIDAEGLILGRLASYAAKQALLGKNVSIINSEKTVISGTRKQAMTIYQQKLHRGDTFRGPFQPIRPDLFLKRTIRGMIPRDKARGREALKRIRCFIGNPENSKPDEAMAKEIKVVAHKPELKFVTVSEICIQMGWKGGRK